MRNRTSAALVLVVLLAGSAPAFLKSYEVVPTQAAWSAWTRRDEPANWVGQTFVCNFDSLAEVALFTGFPGAGGNYDLQVRDLETDDLIAHQYGAGQAGDHRWMRFTAIVPDGKLTRGKEYLVKFTRPGDSIHYYTDIGSRYPYGHLVVGGQFHNGLDLCTRLYGKAYVDGIFSTQSNIPGKDQVIGNDTVPFDKENWHACVEREAEVGVRSDKLGYGYWGWVQRHGPDEWNWGWLDTLMSHYVANGVQPTMSFRGPTGWTTCAVAKVPERPLVWQPNGGAIPKNLYHPVAIPSGGDRVINPDNYYAKYIYEFVRRYGPIGYTFNEQEAGTYWRAHPGTYQPVTLFEGQPEVPWQALAHIDSTPDHPGGYWRLDATRWYQPRGDTGWWLAESLTDQTYRDTISAHIAAHNGDTVAGRKSSLASVYARLVIVVDSAVKLACAQVTQGEEMPRTAAYIFDHGAYGMQNWLQRLKSFGADEHFDVATYFSFHDWRDGNGPEGHRATFRWLRDEMEQAGYAPRNLWATEFGTACPPWAETTRASLLLRSCAIVQAENAKPGYPLEQCSWFTFTGRYMPGVNSPWGITGWTPEFEMKAPAYAYKQWSGLCRRASFEGLVAPAENPNETLWLGCYQFEDSSGRKFWVGWLPWNWPWGPRTLRVPARTDQADTFGVAVGSSVPMGTVEAGVDGWASLALDITHQDNYVPVMIGREIGQNSRPDLRVDSVRFVPPQPQVGMPLLVKVYVKNNGNRATPGYGSPPDSTDAANPTVVHLFWNDVLVDSGKNSRSVPPGGTRLVQVVMQSLPAWMHGAGLLTAAANPGQRYVEMAGLDDNAWYQRLHISRFPTGVVDAVMPPGGKTDVPVVLFRLSSSSWEKDSTGNAPADSARLVQHYYGMDTVALDSAFTGWFGFRSDTSWQFLFGEGKYRFSAEFKDGLENYSPRYPDSSDTVVVFDTTAATGSIGINFGAGFARVPQCTLACAVSDPVAGVHALRIGNRCLSNVVANSGFEQQFGNWQFSAGGGGFEPGSGMALLTAAQSETAWVRQFIPPDSLGPHFMDTLKLSADLLVQMPDADSDEVGQLRLRYYYTPQDPQLNDTTWQDVGSVEFLGGAQALAGLAPIEVGLALPFPEPESGYLWRGGEVMARAWGAGSGNTRVWLDNVKLEPAGPSPRYSWWQEFDSLALWDLEGGSGWRKLWASFQDSSGVESALPVDDSIILDMDNPITHITSPAPGTYVNGAVSVTGWAFDPIFIPGDTFFESRRLYYRLNGSSEWLPCAPDSVSYVPAWPDFENPENPAVLLGVWDTDSVAEGTYWLRLTARDSAGNENSSQTWVVVDRSGGSGGSCSGPEGGGSSIGSGSIWVGSSCGNLLHLSEDLDSLEAFTIADSNQTPSVAGILKLADDTLLVADARSRSVLRLAGRNRFRTRLVQNLSLPSGITADLQGNVWLVDAGTGYILKASRTGTPLLVRGGTGSAPTKLSRPQAVTVKGSRVYVADEGNDRVSVWDTSGTHVLNISGDFERPQAIAVSDSGQLYVADRSEGFIRGINHLGGRFYTLAAEDSGQLSHLCLSQDGRHLFTLKPGTNQVLKFRIGSDDTIPGGGGQAGPGSLPRTFILFQPFPNPAARTRLAVRYGLPRTARVTIRLYDIAGREQRTLVSSEQKPGYHTVFWDRADNKGRTCAQGIYVCRMEAESYRAQRKMVLVR